jgi:hypothetical protein
MKSRVSLLIGATSLAICVVCPLVDLFDQWDHALQTGHDSEYPLVILALCVGAAFVLGRLLLTLPVNLSMSGVRYAILSEISSLPCFFRSPEFAPVLESPPLNLRI